MLVDEDGDPETPRTLGVQHFDAFGLPVTDGLITTGLYAWRGSEGSMTAAAAALVEMGARTYDPATGRFLQADLLPIASVTTQGMNRYIYCENDPVNWTDISGSIRVPTVFGIAFFVGGLIGAIYASYYLDPPRHRLMNKLFKFGLGLGVKACLLNRIKAFLASQPGRIFYDVLHGYGPPNYNPLVAPIGLLAGYATGAVSYAIWTIFEQELEWI
jgi:RHS repeat-associated protein